MKKLKVIVIDDEMLIRKLIRMKMDTKRLNLEVAGEYANGAAALQELKEIRPDIVISDICMPEADGLLFSEECVKLFPEIKIILVTGYDDFEYARRGIKAGVFDYLLKPIQEEELNNALERATEQILKARGQKEKQSQFLYEIQKKQSGFKRYLPESYSEPEPEYRRDERKTSGVWHKYRRKIFQRDTTGTDCGRRRIL